MIDRELCRKQGRFGQRDKVVKIAKGLFGGSITVDNPFSTTDATVIRHSDSRKWIGLIMEVPICRLDLESKASKQIRGRGQKGSGGELADCELTEILNLKADPLLKRDGQTVIPAYHMNKACWISAVLDRASDELVEYLLLQSFELTGR